MSTTATSSGDALSLSHLMLVITEATVSRSGGVASVAVNPVRIASGIIDAVTPDTRARLPHDFHEAVRASLAAAPASPDENDPFLSALPPVLAMAHHLAYVLFEEFEPLRQADAFTPRPTLVRRPFQV